VAMRKEGGGESRGGCVVGVGRERGPRRASWFWWCVLGRGDLIDPIHASCGCVRGWTWSVQRWAPRPAFWCGAGVHSVSLSGFSRWPHSCLSACLVVLAWAMILFRQRMAVSVRALEGIISRGRSRASSLVCFFFFFVSLCSRGDFPWSYTFSNRN
jgi:hypothetical protein